MTDKHIAHNGNVSWRYYLGIAAWFLLIALLFLGLLSFRERMPWYNGGWTGVGKGAAVFFGLVALAGMLFRFSPSEARVLDGEGRVVWGLLAGACGLLFASFYLHDFVYNSPVLWGEWRSALVSSQRIWDTLSAGSLMPPPMYNIGMGYFYLPIYALIGESILATKVLYLVFWTLALGMTAVVWRRWHGCEGALSFLVVVSTLAYGLAAERRYKWHAVAALLVAALFWLASRLERRRGITTHFLFACALAAGIVCYHGCRVYLVFVLVYLLGTSSIVRRGNWMWIVPSALIAVAMAALCERWIFGGGSGFIGILRGYRAGGRSAYPSFIPETFLDLFFRKTGPVASLALVLGLGAGIADFKRNWIAAFSTAGFFLLGSALMATFPFTNIDEANYIVMFVFLVMAYGIYSIVIRIPWTIMRQAVMLLTVWCLARQEYPLYGEFFWSNGCYAMPPIVALLDLKMTETPFKDAVFFPRDGVGPAQGGFGSFWWEVSMMREYTTWFSALRYFDSLEDLRRGVDALMVESDGKRGAIKAYVATTVDREEIDEALDGLNYRCDEIAYFAREWRVRIPVYKLVIYTARPGG